MTVLGVFFTRGVSLKQWVDSGLFGREVLIYQEHLRAGLFERIYWFTYGGADRDLADQLISEGRLPGNIHVIQRPTWIGCFGRAASVLHSFLMPLLAARFLRKCNAFKTNQMDGAIAAVVSATIFRRPLYVRTGYTLSLLVDRIHANNPLRRRFAWLTEYLAFRFCSMSSVSSQHDLEYVVRRYALGKKKPYVVGNFIETSTFSLREGMEKTERIVFVGRLSPEKNLGMAIRACQAVGMGLDIVGDGPERKHLESVVTETRADVKWLGIVANQQLPEVLGQYAYFILPSHWEGMPKALLEAMATGLICIGNNTTGINEIIEDGVTGYLASGPSAPELAEAIRRAIAGDRVSISAAARKFIVRNFSLGAIATKEAQIFSELLSTGAGRARGSSQ